MEINSEATKNETNSMDQVLLSALRGSIVHTKQKGRGWALFLPCYASGLLCLFWQECVMNQP